MSDKKIAVMGYGVVGSGVVEVFYNSIDNIFRKTGEKPDIKYILDIVKHSGTPYDNKFISDFETIVSDPEVCVVAEVIGGTKPAYEYTKRCLEAGKSVVTSNKELVATHGAELLEIAQKHGARYLFEASVGGGMPIIRPLRRCLIANDIEQIAGILNGTTNFILTKMFEENLGMNEALSLAQSLGYAERNPSADIDGHDACRKICILSSLISGKHVYPEEVHVEGIRNVSSQDVEAAQALSHTIKLVAFCKRLENGQLQVVVSPMLVSSKSRLFNVKDVFNGVSVIGSAVGNIAFYGKGAGKTPTASAVVSDIIECISLLNLPEPVLWKDSERNNVVDCNKGNFSFFMRAKKTDSIKDAICSLISPPIKFCDKTDECEFIFDSLPEEKFYLAVEKLSQLGETVYSTYRVLGE